MIPSQTLDEKIRVIILTAFAALIWAIASVILINYVNDLDIMGAFKSEREGSFKYNLFYTYTFAPLWEEAVYRYAPITIAKQLGKEFILPVVVGVSLMFGWGHGEHPDTVLIQGGVGLLLSYAYIKNGYSYISSVLVHSIYNISISLF